MTQQKAVKMAKYYFGNIKESSISFYHVDMFTINIEGLKENNTPFKIIHND
jgi:hypothetical protein